MTVDSCVCQTFSLTRDFQLDTKRLTYTQLLRIRSEIEIPKAASNEVLIKVHAAGINPVDTYIRAGQYIPSRLPALPYTPGGDVCGEVVEVGADVNQFSIGDEGMVRTMFSILFDPYSMTYII